jgi:hypothetical protein
MDTAGVDVHVGAPTCTSALQLKLEMHLWRPCCVVQGSSFHIRCCVEAYARVSKL